MPNVIRRAVFQDLPWVAEVEMHIQETPWSLAIWEMSLMTDAYFFVLEESPSLPETNLATTINPICGFITASVLHPVMEITNVGVASKCQGRGLGQQLLDHLIVYSAEQGMEEIRLEVRISNARAIHLYQKNGFVITAKRKNYYDKADQRQKEDGLLMTRYQRYESSPTN